MKKVILVGAILLSMVIVLYVVILTPKYNKKEYQINNHYLYKETIKKTNRLAKNKTIYVKYKGNVLVDNEYERFIKDSSLVKDSYYNENKKYFIIKLNNTYYHYCGFPKYLWDEFRKTESLGRFYNKNIKGNFDCRYNN